MADRATNTWSECRAFGVANAANTTQLANTLRGLCLKYNSVKVYEQILRIPGKGGATVKLVRRTIGKPNPLGDGPFLAKLPDRWTMLWESLPQRGPIFKELPAAVREVCESHCYSGSATEFWKELGLTFDYDLMKDGNEYHCNHEGFEIRVQLMRIFALQQPGNPDSRPDSGGRDYVVDVTTRVPEGKHIEGARAIGTFGLALQPLVVLIPASEPVKS